MFHSLTFPKVAAAAAQLFGKLIPKYFWKAVELKMADYSIITYAKENHHQLCSISLLDLHGPYKSSCRLGSRRHGPGKRVKTGKAQGLHDLPEGGRGDVVTYYVTKPPYNCSPI